jgi:glutathione S-transferase
MLICSPAQTKRRDAHEALYLAASGYSVADAYLFNLLRWPHRFAIDLATWPALPRFQARVAERPAVRAALEAERA